MIEVIPPSVMLVGAALIFWMHRGASARLSRPPEVMTAANRILGSSMVVVSGIVVGFFSLFYAWASRDSVWTSLLWILCATAWGAAGWSAHRAGKREEKDKENAVEIDTKREDAETPDERQRSGARKIPARYFGVPGMMLLVVPQLITGFLSEPAGPVASAAILVIVVAAAVLMCTGGFILFRDMADRAEQEYRENRDR